MTYDGEQAPLSAGGAAQAGGPRLLEQVHWEVHRIRLFGRQVASPRLSCWIGDAGATYRYSGTRFEPRPWSPALAGLSLFYQLVLLLQLYGRGQHGVAGGDDLGVGLKSPLGHDHAHDFGGRVHIGLFQEIA